MYLLTLHTLKNRIEDTVENFLYNIPMTLPLKNPLYTNTHIQEASYYIHGGNLYACIRFLTIFMEVENDVYSNIPEAIPIQNSVLEHIEMAVCL